MSSTLPPFVPAMVSRVGLAVDGDNRFRGRSLRHEVVGHTSLSGLYGLAINGRFLPPEHCALLDDLTAVLMVADPRIWPHKLGRILSAFGRPAPAFVAAQLACASDSIGPLLLGHTARFLVDLEASLGEGLGDPAAVQQEMGRRLEAKSRLPGFGAPFRASDERVVALRESLVRRGCQTMRYWALAERVAEAGAKLKGLQANIALHGGALCLDVGFRPEEVGPLMLGLFGPVFLGGVHEGAQCREEQLRCLPPDAVEYRGPAPRLSPRAQEKKSQAAAL